MVGESPHGTLLLKAIVVSKIIHREKLSLKSLLRRIHHVGMRLNEVLNMEVELDGNDLPGCLAFNTHPEASCELPGRSNTGLQRHGYGVRLHAITVTVPRVKRTDGLDADPTSTAPPNIRPNPRCITFSRVARIWLRQDLGSSSHILLCW